MIKSFRHKGLQKFFSDGNAAGIQHNHIGRLEERLQLLHVASIVEDMNIPGWRLHKLHGNKSEHWAINVSGNWRIVFEFRDGNAYIVDYLDYH